MTDSNGLAEFLNARLDEDEAVARTSADADGHHADGWTALVDAACTGLVVDARDPDYAITTDTLEEIVVHIARHDPARTLREVSAKRAILATHLRTPHRCPLPVLAGEHGQLWTAEEGPCWTLRLLARVYSDHSDYDPDWSVD